MSTKNNSGQGKKIESRVLRAFKSHPTISNVSALARKLRRPRTSVSRAVHHPIFPDLQKEIEKALEI